MEEKHNNLYYLFQVDQAAHPMDPERASKMLEQLNDFLSANMPQKEK